MSPILDNNTQETYQHVLGYYWLKFKGARPDCFRFFPYFPRFLLSGESSYFLYTTGEFYNWKVYHLEDINENVTSYDNNS